MGESGDGFGEGGVKMDFSFSAVPRGRPTQEEGGDRRRPLLPCFPGMSQALCGDVH